MFCLPYNANPCNSFIFYVWQGNGSNRWFDKSFNLVVFANGKAGLTVEHSVCTYLIFEDAKCFNTENQWADAPVPAHMFEWCLAEEFMGPGYDDVTGCNKALPQPKHMPRPPIRLKWGSVCSDVLAAVEDGLERANAQIQG